MKLSLDALAELVNGTVVGDASTVISGVANLGNAGDGQITFLSNSRFASALPNTKAAAVILKQGDVQQCPVNAIVVEDPYLAYAVIATALTEVDDRPPGIHPSAIVSETATVHASAFIGPNAVIENNVHVGAHVCILANSYIGHHSVIDESVIIYSNVSIYANTQIGANSIIHSGAIIGADGFGFAPRDGEWIRIPQLGCVVLGKNVEIGANSTVDRGAIDNTIIGDGVKIDNLVQVGHNVQIGKHTAIAACAGVAGSAKIGAYCTIGGAANINGHIEIADRVHINGAAMVTKSIKFSGAYASGMPAEPVLSWRKSVARFRRLEQLEQRVKSLEAELNSLKGS